MDVVKVEGDVQVDQVVKFSFLTLRVQVRVDGAQVGLHYGHQVGKRVADLKKQKIIAGGHQIKANRQCFDPRNRVGVCPN